MKNRKTNTLILGSVVALALISAGCSSAPTSFPLGTYFTQITDADIPSDFPLDVLDLRGEWEIEFTEAGRFFQRQGGVERVTGDYSSDAETIEFEDEGHLSCSFSDLGKGLYEWSQDGDTIRFVLISDRCDGRAIIFTAHPFESR